MFTNGIKLFPIILQAPRLFAGQIKIGDIQQTVQAFARLQNALSFFRMFYNKFTAYRARLERLYGFLLSTEEKHTARQPDLTEVSDGLILENVALYRHNGEVLLDGININLKSGNSLLIRGPSGCGKLRCCAHWQGFGLSAAAVKSAIRRFKTSYSCRNARTRHKAAYAMRFVTLTSTNNIRNYRSYEHLPIRLSR